METQIMADSMVFTNLFFKVLWIVNMVFIIALTVCYYNQVFHMVMSVIVRKKRYKETETRHNYAFLIAARNEEKVIGDLINSIKNQNYPQELMHVFVVADNCTDNTSRVAQTAGAIVFERFDDKNIGKSYAMEYAFKRIMEEYKDLGIDGYFIFDADNLLHPDFMKEMNKAFSAGNQIITGYRAPKNFSDSWLSGGSSYMYLREMRQMHHSRSRLGIGTYVSGTGYLISSEYIRKFNGWPFHTLVEDVEVSAVVTKMNDKVAFCEDAVFYDEQPSELNPYWRQRLRWSRGNHEVFFKEGGQLFFSLLKRPSLTKWGMFVHILPLPAVTFLWFLVYTLIGLAYFVLSTVPFDVYLHECLRYCVEDFVYPFVMGWIAGLLTMIQCYRQIDARPIKKVWYMMLFPVAMYLFFPITTIALFVKVKWKPIQHKKSSLAQNV